MSATIDESTYRTYFNCPGNPPAQVSAKGRRFDVSVNYLDQINLGKVKNSKIGLATSNFTFCS